jgi:hypothetical protein
MDVDGSWWWYENKPEAEADAWYSGASGSVDTVSRPDWRNTLQLRPAVSD